jgi:hypothetical protein
MMTLRRGVALTAALLVCAATVGASSANAYSVETFMDHTYLESGQNYFAKLNYTFDVFGESAGSAATCVGIQGYGKNCGGEGQPISYTLVGGAYASGYLHNHSTWNSYFYGETIYE